MHGGILMTMNEKRTGHEMRQNTSEQESNASDSGIHAFVHGFYYACGNCGGDNAVPVIGAASG